MLEQQLRQLPTFLSLHTSHLRLPHLVMQGGTAAPKAADFPISPSIPTLYIHTSPQHLSSTLCRMEQQLRQLLSSRGQALTGDDGILDCLDYFAGRGDYVVLVTGD